MASGAGPQYVFCQMPVAVSPAPFLGGRPNMNAVQGQALSSQPMLLPMGLMPAPMFFVLPPGTPSPVSSAFTPPPFHLVSQRSNESTPQMPKPPLPLPPRNRRNNSEPDLTKLRRVDNNPFVQQPLRDSPLANTTSLLQSSTVKTEHKRKMDLDFDSTLNDAEGTLMSTLTVNSFEDFGLELKELAAADTDPAATAKIEELRKETTDRSVRARVLKLPTSLCLSMVCNLEHNEELMMELCLKERGNIVAHLVEKLGGEQSFPLVKFALDNFLLLAQNQSGCICLPRILSSVKPSQRDVFFETTCEHFGELFNHPYGNYVIKHFISTCESSYLKAMCDWLLAASNLITCAKNKHGSHLIEDIFKHSGTDTLRPLIHKMFGEESVLRECVHDKFANYVVQSAFRFLENNNENPAIPAWCTQQLLPVIRTSPYQQNIMKHALASQRHGRRTATIADPFVASADPKPTSKTTCASEIRNENEK